MGPGHGGPAAVANAWLEGSWSEHYSEVDRDEDGMRRLFRQFSFPGGIPSHVAPEVPGSIHEGGELGYALAHAYGAAFDNPDLVVACIVGDGEAETGPLAASWHSNKFLDPIHDGAVLPILQLNGYKIANPTVLARIPEDELRKLFEGYGHEVLIVAGDDPADVHQMLATAVDSAFGPHRRDPTRRPRRWRRCSPEVADDRAAHPQGLDRTARGRRCSGRGHVAGPPGAARRRAQQPRPPPPTGGVDAQLPARGVVRRRGPSATGRPRARRRRAPAG